MYIEELYDERTEDIRISSKIIFKLEKEDLSAYARQYVNKSDPLYELASKIKPLNDFEDFLIHGQPNLVEYETTNGQWIQLTAEDYAEALKQDEEYHGGNIRLLACKSGMLNDGFAQQLANIMNVKVIAPTQTLWIRADGEMFISDSEILADMWNDGEKVIETGAWKVFIPQKG